jgi:hypothetical protein
MLDPYAPSIPEAVAHEAGRLADEHGVAPDRAAALLTRLAHAALRDEPAGSVADDWLPLVREALDRAPGEESLALFEDDTALVLERVRFADWAAGEPGPLYTLDELADLTDQFADAVEQDADHLVGTGLPSRRFRPCRWLYLRLGRLYDTRTTDSPWPADEFAPEPVPDSVPPYRWVRRVSQPGRGRFEGVTIQERLQCEYHEADLLRVLDPDDVPRLEAARAILHPLKVAVLRTLAHAARARDADGVWPRCWGLVAEALPRPERLFLLGADRRYLETDATRGGLDEARRKMIPGGLSDLLEVVGHVEAEARFGSLARTREALGPLVTREPHPRLRVTGDGHAYFYFLRRPANRRRVDEALEEYVLRDGEVRCFWAEYRRRVQRAVCI